MKPSDQDPHFFHSACEYIILTGMLNVNRIEMGRSVVHKNSARQELIKSSSNRMV